MELLTTLLTSQTMQEFVNGSAWVWTIAEIFHFFGMALLIGTIGALDLRMLGFAKALPVAALERLVPWGIAGFVICLVSGLVFVTGIKGGAGASYFLNFPFQAKILFLLLAGINVGAFYLAGVSNRADETQAGESAPLAARIIAGVSLFLWVGVIYFGRMIMYASTPADIFRF